MKKRFIIKTVDGNRYETDEVPFKTTSIGTDWLEFPINDGVGNVDVNIANIVCIIVKEVDE